MSRIWDWPQLNGLLLRPPRSRSNLHISEVDELKLSRLASTCQIFALTINQYNLVFANPNTDHIWMAVVRNPLVIRFSLCMKWAKGQITSEKMMTNIGSYGPKSQYISLISGSWNIAQDGDYISEIQKRITKIIQYCPLTCGFDDGFVGGAVSTKGRRLECDLDSHCTGGEIVADGSENYSDVAYMMMMLRNLIIIDHDWEWSYSCCGNCSICDFYFTDKTRQRTTVQNSDSRTWSMI